ncbi:U7 snRNA-associated Sm-like protein LSm11 [Salarias fasciatus]|uniref:Sm domain-containing protein n=1 Tax=Salarias fasciatus TaxID=181472 RepID=A0A672FFJ5_SALFA|nr:U7 snRNA-associated Sm-like protein LSm11 [Salarias fasciatus]
MEERERQSAKPDSKDGAPAPSSSTPTAPGHKARAASKDEDDEAGKTNVCSENFDPLLALYSPAVPLPFPDIKSFNNVAAYESFLKGGRGRAKPENVEKRQRKAMKGVVDPERIERLKRLMVNNPAGQPEEGEGEGSGTAPRRRRRQRPQKNVLTRMTLCAGSPLGELYRFVQERIRVRVHIRTFKGLRGVCSGFVVAFDKFWNMAMVDVDETYKEPVFGEEFYHEKALTVTRLFEKLKLQESEASSKTVDAAGRDSQTSLKSSSADARDDGRTPESEQGSASRPKKATQKGRHRVTVPKPYGKVHTRHVNQLFIRGENVILVNPQPLGPAT